MNKELSVFLLVLFASIWFSLDGVVMRLSGLEDGLLIAALKGLGACLFLMIYKRRFPKFRKGLLFFGAVLGSFVGTICFPLAVTMIPLGVAMILFHAAILWIIILKRIFGQAISWLDRITGMFIFLGIVILLFNPHEINAWGTLVGLIAGIGFAIFLFLGEKEGYKTPEDHSVLLDAFLFAQIGVTLFGFLGSGTIISSLEFSNFNQQIILIDGIMYGIAYIILSKGIKLGSSHLVAAYIGGLEPFLAIIFARIFLGEEIQWQMKWGFLLVAGAIISRSLILYQKESQKTRCS